MIGFGRDKEATPQMDTALRTEIESAFRDEYQQGKTVRSKHKKLRWFEKAYVGLGALTVLGGIATGAALVLGVLELAVLTPPVMLTVAGVVASLFIAQTLCGLIGGYLAEQDLKKDIDNGVLVKRYEETVLLQRQKTLAEHKTALEAQTAAVAAEEQSVRTIEKSLAALKPTFTTSAAPLPTTVTVPANDAPAPTQIRIGEP